MLENMEYSRDRLSVMLASDWLPVMLAFRRSHSSYEASHVRNFEYLDSNTERRFNIREYNKPNSEFPELTDSYYLLEEYIPNGRIYNCRLNRGWEEPLIEGTEKRIGPNGLIAELRRMGVDVDSMVKPCGGAGGIHYDSLEGCAEAIFNALRDNVRYKKSRKAEPELELNDADASPSTMQP